jgi:hypothetical protein
VGRSQGRGDGLGQLCGTAFGNRHCSAQDAARFGTPLHGAAILPLASGGSKLAFVAMGGTVPPGQPAWRGGGEGAGATHGARQIRTALNLDEMRCHEAWLKRGGGHGRALARSQGDGLDASVIEAAPLHPPKATADCSASKLQGASKIEIMLDFSL